MFPHQIDRIVSGNTARALAVTITEECHECFRQHNERDIRPRVGTSERVTNSPANTRAPLRKRWM